MAWVNMIIEEKIVCHLKCAVEEIEGALRLLRKPSCAYETKKVERLMKAKFKLQKTLRKNYNGYI